MSDALDLDPDPTLELIADSLLAMPDAELLALARKCGIDPKEAASRMRAAYARAQQVVGAERRRRAREAWVESSETDRDVVSGLPTTAEACRALLQRVFAVRPQLTAQFRDLTTLSDADVQRLLADLVDIGVLTPDGEIA